MTICTANSSANTNGVGLLSLGGAAGSYDAAQIDAIASKIDELITALRR